MKEHFLNCQFNRFVTLKDINEKKPIGVLKTVFYFLFFIAKHLKSLFDGQRDVLQFALFHWFILFVYKGGFISEGLSLFLSILFYRRNAQDK